MTDVYAGSNDGGAGMSARHWTSHINSGGGHSIPTLGAGLKNAPDCPVCKYGTLVEAKDGMRCIDCKHVYTMRELVKQGIMPKPRRG